MTLNNLATVEQLQGFLSGTQDVAFAVLDNKDACYRWLQKERVRWRYLTRSRADKGLISRYLMKVSGYSQSQLTRLIAQYRETGQIKRSHSTVAGFACRYTAADKRLLATIDELHDTPCGPAVKKLCERAYTVFGEQHYERLATISVSHIYNLRRSATYTCQRHHFTQCGGLFETRPQF